MSKFFTWVMTKLVSVCSPKAWSSRIASLFSGMTLDHESSMYDAGLLPVFDLSGKATSEFVQVTGTLVSLCDKLHVFKMDTLFISELSLAGMDQQKKVNAIKAGIGRAHVAACKLLKVSALHIVPFNAFNVLDKGFVLFTKDIRALFAAEFDLSEDDIAYFSKYNEKSQKLIMGPMLRGTEGSAKVAVFPIEKQVGIRWDGELLIHESNSWFNSHYPVRGRRAGEVFQIRGRCRTNIETGKRAGFNGLKGKCVVLKDKDFRNAIALWGKLAGVSSDDLAKIDHEFILATDMSAKRMKSFGLWNAIAGVNCFGFEKWSKNVTLGIQVLSRTLAVWSDVIGKGGKAHISAKKQINRCAAAVAAAVKSGDTTLLKEYLSLVPNVDWEHLESSPDFRMAREIISNGHPFGAANMDGKAATMLLGLIRKSSAWSTKGFWQYSCSPGLWNLITGTEITESKLGLGKRAEKALWNILTLSSGYVMAFRNPPIWGEAIGMHTVILNEDWYIDGIACVGGARTDMDFDGDTINVVSPFEILPHELMPRFAELLSWFWAHVSTKMMPYQEWSDKGGDISEICSKAFLAEPLTGPAFAKAVVIEEAAQIGVGLADNIITAFTMSGRGISWKVKAVCQTIVEGMKHADRGGVDANKLAKHFTKELFKGADGMFKFVKSLKKPETDIAYDRTSKKSTPKGWLTWNAWDFGNMSYAIKNDILAHFAYVWEENLHKTNLPEQWTNIRWNDFDMEVNPLVAFVMGGTPLRDHMLSTKAISKGEEVDVVGTLLAEKTILGKMFADMNSVKTTVALMHLPKEAAENVASSMRGAVMTNGKNGVLGLISWFNTVQERIAQFGSEWVEKDENFLAATKGITHFTKTAAYSAEDYNGWTGNVRWLAYKQEFVDLFMSMSVEEFVFEIAKALFHTHAHGGNKLPLYLLGQELSLFFMDGLTPSNDGKSTIEEA